MADRKRRSLGATSATQPWKRPSARVAPTVAWPTWAGHVVAEVVFDSLQQSCFAGMRAATATARRVLFQAEGHELDLEIRPELDAGRVDLLGHVLRVGAEPGEGWLRLSRPTVELLGQIDPNGEFRIGGIEPGAYRLEVVFKDRLIEVPVLPL